jgi:regulator of protease activity HflC (stomatin/prohibitin superfamily)
MGIGSVLGLLALLGYAMFVGGIALAFVAASQGRPARGGALLALVGLVLGLLLSVVSQGILVLQANQSAVIFNTLSGDFAPSRYGGTSVIVPIMQTASIYPISQQSYSMVAEASVGETRDDEPVGARSIDGQEVTIDVTILYSINPDDANLQRFHVRWGDRYIAEFIRPTARSVVREAVARFRAEDIYGEGRTEMEETMETLMRTRIEREGFILTDLLVRGVQFSDQFRQSVEEKLVAEQQAQQAAFQVQQEQQEAERVRVRAAGARDATIAEAEGEARSIILRAEAEAEALRLVSEQIAANPALIQYQYVQNLSDNINLALVPSNTPFLFDFNALTAQANPDFVAPTVPETTDTFTTPPEVVPEETPTPGG